MIPIIPRPEKVDTHQGVCQLHNLAGIIWKGKSCQEIAGLLAEYLHDECALELPVGSSGEIAGAAISLQADAQNTCTASHEADESYHMEVTPEGIHIAAPTNLGVARGIQALRQLWRYSTIENTQGQTIPACRIEDKPRYAWRGMHVDVARHFFGVDTILRLLDKLALYQYNVMHLHMTEDQGWRVPIEGYPELTRVGAWRPCTLIGHMLDKPYQFDNTPHGGAYTRQDIDRIITEATRRGIMVVPEIDMPGHAQAAIAAYPSLGTLETPTDVRCHWGISQHTLNVEPSTMKFVQDVLEQVMDMFPGPVVHLGGDEVLTPHWANSRRIHQRMIEIGVKDEHELYGWFLEQAASHVLKAGRRVAAWDELAENGALKEAVIMSWRARDKTTLALEGGYDTVVCQKDPLYLNFYQHDPEEQDHPLSIGGLNTLKDVYQFVPVPEEVDASCHEQVMGMQGQLWSEYIATEALLMWMAFPRGAALAEVAWSDPSNHDFADFQRRLEAHQKDMPPMPTEGPRGRRRTPG